MADILVACYSRSGHTRRVGEALARRLGADLEAIAPTRDREGPLGYVRSALEAIAEVPASTVPPRRDPAAYRLVVIGTPVWFWSLASPVRGYVLEERRRFARVAFFCTMGRSGAERVFADLARLTGRKPVATLALTDAEIDAGFAKALDGFVRALRAGRGTPRGRRRRAD